MSHKLDSQPDRIERLQSHANNCLACLSTRAMANGKEWFNLAEMVVRCTDARDILDGVDQT